MPADPIHGKLKYMALLVKLKFSPFFSNE